MNALEGDAALVIVDMQNDFLHPDGGFAARARANPRARIDLDFLRGAIPATRRLADGFRAAARPVIYVTHVVRSDFTDGQWPWWRLGHKPGQGAFVEEGGWGARIVDELRPEAGDHIVVKKGFNGFANTSLDPILRNLGVRRVVVCGVTTCVCVSSTVRGGVDHNYRMVVVEYAVAEVDRETHAAELRTMARVFADVAPSLDVLAALARG